MDAGDLRHRVTLQRKVQVRDSEGGVVTDWEDVATVWAKIAPLSAREFTAAAAVQSKVVARITIRFRDGVVASMRAVHGAKLYNIEGVLPDQESGLEYLTLPVSEGVNEG